MGIRIKLKPSGTLLVKSFAPWRLVLSPRVRFTTFDSVARASSSGKAPKCQEEGYTLLELLLVIAIILTLGGIAIPVYSNQISKTKNVKAITDIKTIEKEIEVYKGNNGTLPSYLTDIGRGNLMDPWGKPYQYANHGLIPPGERRKYHGTVPLNMDYDLFSMGPDGEFRPPLTAKQSRDDIIRADDGGYVGPASEY